MKRLETCNNKDGKCWKERETDKQFYEVMEIYLYNSGSEISDVKENISQLNTMPHANKSPLKINGNGDKNC